MSMRESDLVNPVARLRETEVVRKVEPERERRDRPKGEPHAYLPEDYYEGGAPAEEENSGKSAEESIPKTPREEESTEEGIDLIA